MSRLGLLRSHLSQRRQRRSFLRNGSALAALGLAVLWTLAALFVVDWLLQTDPAQRVVLLVLGAIAVGVAFKRYSWPLFGGDISEVQAALQVEREHGIDTDLVAALQFERPEARTWGSALLQTAVIDEVAQQSRGLDACRGLDRGPFLNRSGLFVATAALVTLFAVSFPAYARTFVARLMLSRQHYPSQTHLEQLLVNSRPVLLSGTQHDVSPERVRSAQGREVTFSLHASGRLPAQANIRLAAEGGEWRTLELKRLSDDQRLARLREALGQIEAAQNDPGLDVAGPWADSVKTLTRFDAPDAIGPLESAAEDRTALASAAAAIRRVVDAWADRSLSDKPNDAVYEGQLPRLVDPIRYRLRAGDAWTELGRIDMIPLPVVEPRFAVTPPAYAHRPTDKPIDPTSRQLAVLEGSRVGVSVVCTNGKPLREVWLVLKGRESPRFPLVPADTKDGADKKEWTLAAETPLDRITEELRFEIQATDSDGLHLESPIRGHVRLRADRPPSGAMKAVHRVVLPSAKPAIEFRAGDDYGIAKLVLHTELERGQDVPDAPAPGAIELSPEQPRLADKLPWAGSQRIDLSSWKLAKGDRVRLVLEVLDFRGDAPGESFRSEPLVLEISDEAGVLAAIAEADERSEQRLTDIIKQQLGIGD